MWGPRIEPLLIPSLSKRAPNFNQRETTQVPIVPWQSSTVLAFPSVSLYLTEPLATPPVRVIQTAILYRTSDYIHQFGHQITGRRGEAEAGQTTAKHIKSIWGQSRQHTPRSTPEDSQESLLRGMFAETCSSGMLTQAKAWWEMGCGNSGEEECHTGKVLHQRQEVGFECRREWERRKPRAPSFASWSKDVLIKGVRDQEQLALRACREKPLSLKTVPKQYLTFPSL